MPTRKNRRAADAGKHPSARFGSQAKGSTEDRYPAGTTPAERTIIDHSRDSDRGERGQKVLIHPDGARSSVLSGSVEHPRLNEGRPTLVPKLREGKIITNDDEAAERAVRSGKKYPSYRTHDEATEASKRISSGLERQSPTRRPLK